MVNEVKWRPSLSVLLALKGVSSFGGRLYGYAKGRLARQNHCQAYISDPDLTKKNELHAGNVKLYEYDGEPAQRRFEG